MHGCEIRDHVRRQIRGRVADLVQQLFRDRFDLTAPPFPPASSGGTPSPLISAIGYPTCARSAGSAIAPQAAGRLAAALDQVAGHRAGEAIPVVPRPAELMRGGRDRQRGIGDAAGDHDRGSGAAPPRSAGRRGRRSR